MNTSKNPGTITIEDGRFKFHFDPEPFWKGICQALAGYFNNEYGGMTKDLLASAASFSKTNTLEHKAYRLIYTALHKSCVSVLTEYPDQQRLLEKIIQAGVLSNAFRFKMSQKLSAGDYTMDSSFFLEPWSTVFVKDAQLDYRAFLCTALELEEKHADTLAAVLPGRFVRELALEWERADYEKLIAFFKNPFLEPLKKLAIGEARHADLLTRFAKPAFNDPMVTLAEMYIEPDFWIHGSCIPEKEKGEGKAFASVKHKSGQHDFFSHKDHSSLHPFILKWLKQTPCLSLPGEKDSILIILGQPGQGKSSSFLRTIDLLLREHKGTMENIFLVRLRDIESAAKLIDDPLSVICKHLKLGDESQLKDSLLLLDGLDELYMSQGLTLPQIHDFVGKLRKQLKNDHAPGIRIALTSRTNYLKLDDLSAEDYLIVHLADMSLDQQKEWLRRYRKHYEQDCVLTESDLEKVAKDESAAYQKIRELINQPILLQMIAASGMQIDGNANSALIYKELFDKLIKRDWSPEDGQLDKFKKLTADDLRRFLRTLALHIYQKPSNHEYARRLDFEQEGPLKDETERLAKKLGMDELPLKDMVKDLLVSFYFQEVQRDSEEKRRSNDSDNYAYEFLHKSLQEYLVAEKIWETCKTKLLAKEEGEFRIQKTKEVYELIAPLFEPKVLTQEVADYLQEIISNDAVTDKGSLKQRLKHFLPGLLNASFLLKHEHKDGEPAPLDKMLGNFFGYWTLASALIIPQKVDMPDEKAQKADIERENLIPGEKVVFAHLCVLLQRAHFRRLRLYLQDLSGADLSGADLRGADLRGAYLIGAYLRGAYLHGAYLRGAYLSGAYLRGAVLQGCILWSQNWEGAKFENARMEDIIGLDKASGLEKANFKGTIYEGKFSKKSKPKV